MATAQEAAEPAKKSRLSLVLVLVLVVGLGGAGAGVFALLKLRGGKTTAEAAHSEEKQAEAAPEPGVISLEPFLTNLAGEDSDRYVKCTIRLEIDRREIADKVKADDLSITRLRDKILTLLTSKQYAEISSGEGKERLRAEIRERIEPLLQGSKIREVYYTEFLVQ